MLAIWHLNWLCVMLKHKFFVALSYVSPARTWRIQLLCSFLAREDILNGSPLIQEHVSSKKFVGPVTHELCNNVWTMTCMHQILCPEIRNGGSSCLFLAAAPGILEYVRGSSYTNKKFASKVSLCFFDAIDVLLFRGAKHCRTWFYWRPYVGPVFLNENKLDFNT